MIYRSNGSNARLLIIAYGTMHRLKKDFECNLQDTPDLALNHLCLQKHTPDNFPFK